MRAKVVARLVVVVMWAVSLTASAEHVIVDGNGRLVLDPAIKGRLQQLVQTADTCGLRLDPNLPNLIESAAVQSAGGAGLGGGALGLPPVPTNTGTDTGTGGGAAVTPPAEEGGDTEVVEKADAADATSETNTEPTTGADDAATATLSAGTISKCAGCHVNGKGGPNFGSETALLAKIKAKPAKALSMATTKAGIAATSDEYKALQAFATAK